MNDDTISGAEDNTDVGAGTDPQPETNVDVEVNNGSTEQAEPAQTEPDANDTPDDSNDSTDGDES